MDATQQKAQLNEFLKPFGTRQLEPEKLSLIPSARITLLFQWFSQYYNTRWCAGKDAEDVKNLMLLWDQCLKYISDKDMNGGMEILKYYSNKYIKFPPTPNEFRELCKCAANRRCTTSNTLKLENKEGTMLRDMSSEKRRKLFNEAYTKLGRLDLIR